jgi:hypothetical protein
MKHLSRREDFLNRNKYIKITNIINEEAGGPFTNDIPWGDSLVGRLINSFRRKAGIGYNLTKVKSLLNSFKAELDMLIASSLSRDTQNEFDKLRLKNIFHDLREQCTNDVDDPTKLNTLIGGNQGLWNNQQQNGGDWANVLTHGVLVDAHDFIQSTMDKETLEKAGIPRDGLLDNMTIFIDNLRRLTVPQTGTNSNPVVGRRGFPLNFSNLVNSLSNVRESFKLSGYYDFIFEEKGVDYQNLKNITDPKEIQIQINRLKNELKTNRPDEQVNKINQHIKNLEAKLSPNSKELAITNQPDKGLTTTEQPDKGLTTTEQPDKEVATNISKIKLLKQLAIQLVPNLKDLDTEEEILNNQTAQRFLLVVKSLDENDLTQLSDKNTDLKIKIDDKELTLSDAINTFSKSKEIEKIPGKTGAEKPVDKSKFDTKIETPKAGETSIMKPGEDADEETEDVEAQEVKDNQSYKYSGYSPIYEAATASATFSTVEGAWDLFLSDSNIPRDWLDISQREIDRLIDLTDGYETGKLPLNFNIQLNPDPIIGICRIFKRAHDLYFTPIIPSGRTNGKVSNITYREYEKLGGVSGQSDPSSPGYGPWAVKKIREQWNDGVLAIIEDQKYRKILSNVRFIVPGSEDSFNRTSESRLMRFNQFYKVFEAGETTDNPVGGQLGVDKKSHGQILFDFINDLLDNKTAADFDNQRRILLKKYFEPFGFKVPQERDINPPASKTPIAPDGNPEDFPKKALYWKTDTTFSTVSTADFKGPFYALPIKEKNRHKIIFAHLLKKVAVNGFNGTCYYVKFLFNTQANVGDLIPREFNGYDMSNSMDLGDAVDHVYYGIISITGNNISLVYSSVNGGEWENINGGKNFFELLGASDDHELDGRNGKVTVFRGKLYSKDDSGTENVVDTKFCGNLKAEKTSHMDNLSLTPKDTTKFNNAKLMDALVEEAKNKFI